MAALVQGVQYGLSSQGNVNEDKDLIFVKLTESACRAFEEYIKNKNKSSERPTIQFLGNEGRMSIPCPQSSHGHARFNFSLSNTSDIEGQQGSFECMRQAGSKTIESLGPIHCKMRIHAKEDVYEATRHRVAAMEEKHKKICTREIKPGGPGIGKKVKVKNGSVMPLKRDRDSSVKAYTKPLSNGYAPAIPRNGIVNNGNFQTSTTHTKPQANNHAQKPGNPELMKKPIRERLIHLLALRPYKKPELYDRIIKDGLRERDKHNVSNVLKQIAFMRDNTYHLIRHIWNEVQDEWPIYTDQEKQLLKRRKPQNLTPPGSSDGGSSGSGQSPTSTHPGSPPSTISTVKRPGYFEGNDGLPTKRPRISHYRKPEASKPEPPSRRTDRDASNMNPRSREYDSGVVRNGYQSNYNPLMTTGNGLCYNSILDRRCVGEDEENEEKFSSLSKRDSVSKRVDLGRESDRDRNRERVSDRSSCRSLESLKMSLNEDARRSDNGVLIPASGRGHGGHHNNRDDRWTNGIVASPPKQESKHEEKLEDEEDEEDKKAKSESLASEYPEYLTSYSTILNSEQRSRYKADFNAHYTEYRELHAIVEKVSQRFAQLEAQLMQEERDSPEWRSVKNQIVYEYQENQRDHEHQAAKLRFQYLHEKLSHIKRLVLEYDSSVAANY